MAAENSGPYLYIRKRPCAGGEDDVVERLGPTCAIIQDPARKPRRRPRVRLPAGATWWEAGVGNDQVGAAFAPALERCAAGEGPGALWVAYGQTGSGKTHTLTGTGPDEGLLQRALRRLAPGVRFRAVQLHNESPTCLLSGRPVRMECLLAGAGDGSGAEVALLSSPEDARAALARVARRREVGSTALNSRSSRAHTIYLCDLPGGSRAAFLDLAGNEKGRFSLAGDRAARRECAAINQSLFALKECIRALHRGGGAPRHVPFRRSKLTRFLQGLLDQRLALHFVATIHPCTRCMHDCADTLRYASAVAAWSAPPPPATTVPSALYESYVMKLYRLVSRDADLHRKHARQGRPPPRETVLALLRDKLRFLQASSRVFAAG